MPLIPKKPIPPNYNILQLSRLALMVGARGTTNFVADGYVKIKYHELESLEPILKNLNLDLKSGSLVFLAVFPIKK